MATCEHSFCKVTLFLIKDWDSFQMAMRLCLGKPVERILNIIRHD